jgi:lipopolysaccharide/colanic/teichoic acid biosynthesis glycosyltransferase
MSTILESQQKSKRRPLLLTKIAKPRIENDQSYPMIKRVLELAVCIALLPMLLCLIAIIAAAITLDSPGSPFFIQERVGKDGRRFWMYKFRTLRQDYDNCEHRAYMQAFVLGQNDVRVNRIGHNTFKPPFHNSITRVGSILRKTSLDELPQIFNVLKGDMSLIGPRPNVIWEVEKYKDWHYERLKVLPGITGLAQVRGRSSITFDDIVMNDLEYIEKQSLKVDLQILLWTMLAVLGRKGVG